MSINGFLECAELFEDPHLATVPKFSALNRLTLLTRAAELVHLRRKLRWVAAKDREDPEKKRLANSWYHLSKANADGEYNMQWEVMQEIQAKLKEYSMTETRLLPLL
jgi:hypothetical protein